jgi:carboxyl-terminal processing protease
MTNRMYRRQAQVFRRACGVIILLATAGWCRADAPAGPEHQAVALWKKACRDIVAGKIESGSRIVRQLATGSPASVDLEQVEGWLADYDDLQKERDRYRQADLDYEVAQVRETLKKEEWVTAMQHLAGAYETAKDRSEFVKDPWTQNVVAKAKEQADSLYKKGEWRDAAGMYACLEHIFEDHPEYEKSKRRCLRHARLEAVYKKESKDRWQKDLYGIEPSMVEDAFVQMSRHYVRKADFKKALKGGIENLLILAKTTNLANTFEGLSDRENVVRFTGDLMTLSHQVDDAGEIDAGDATKYFNRILRSNARTIALPGGLVINEFMSGALYPLDHFSSMIWPSDLIEFKKHTMGKFQGVGIQIRKRDDGKLLVVTPLPGTPAHKAGMKPGDIILKVNDEDISALELDEVVPKIMVEKGSVVRLTVQRGKAEPFVVPIKRDVIVIRSVRGYRRDEQGAWDYMIDPKQRIAYLRIDPSFTDGTVQEMRNALSKIKEQGARALILDVRFNPGGLLRTAIEVTDLFLPPGKKIVSTRGQRSEAWSAPSTSEPFFSKDMVVLVNQTSASASEILAGALQDNQRAIVLGSRTHGKGSVQNLIPLANETAYLKLTTALYYLPGDRCPHKWPGAKEWGVPPDIEVALRPEERVKVARMRRDSDILGEKVDFEDEATTQPTTTQAAAASQPTTGPSFIPIDDRPDIDPQTEAALLVLRVKLLSGQPWTWAPRAAPESDGKTAWLQK